MIRLVLTSPSAGTSGRQALRSLPQKLTTRVHRIAAELMGRVLHFHAESVVTRIRSARPFRYRVPQPGHRPGSLQSGMWVGRPRRIGAELTNEIGWSVPHGPLMEWGPKKKQWKIVPKGFVKLTRGAHGPKQKMRFLRWVTQYRWAGKRANYKFAFATQVIRKWSPSELRPHVAPALEAQRPLFQRDAAQVIVKAIEQVLR